MPPAPQRLGLMLVSDGRGDAARLDSIASAAFEGGAALLQVREPAWDLATIERFIARIQPTARARGARIIVNGIVVPGADGVHLPVRLHGTAAADAASLGFCGFAAHDPTELARAAGANADYATLSPVLPTPCKPGARPIGLDAARAWTEAAALPVLWLGGINLATALDLNREPCAGVAVRSAICDAADPRAATATLCAALGL